MKNIVILALLMSVVLSSAHADYYYYSDNRQIPLYVDSSRVLISFTDPLQFDEFQESYPRIDSLEAGFAQDQFRIASLSTGANLDEFIDSLRTDGRVGLVNRYFVNSKDSSLMAGRTICCKFGDNVSYGFIDSLNAEYDVEIVYEDEFTQKLFLLSVEDGAQYSTTEIANIYYELEETDFCHPNFLGGFEWFSYPIYDHYWQEQWGMERIFRADENSPDSLNHRAFEITTGDTNLIIAVLDMGVGEHEDIPADRIVEGYDFANTDDDASPCDFPNLGFGGHGQCLAGIIGASQNRDPDSINNPNTGIYGIAASCKLMSIKVGNGFICSILEDDPAADSMWVNYPLCRGYYFVGDEKFGQAIRFAWQNGADIISISWGQESPFDRVQFELQQAITYGRDGKGCGIFCAAGNTPGAASTYPAMYPEVISVGSITPDDSVWSYSWRGKVDVVAPSGPTGGVGSDFIWSTDLMGDAGYNGSAHNLGCGNPDDDDYICLFGGTSAAQPVAAGVAAMVLSVKPNLTYDQLYDIIKCSADSDLYVTITNPPDSSYGYGMVHPMRALLAVSRGDANNSKSINLLDILYLIAYIYNNPPGPEPVPHPLMGDADGNGVLNLLDILYLMSYIYDNPPGPPPPISCNYGNYDF